MHVPNKERKKLQPRSTKFIFFGYSDHKKAYRLYDPTTKKIVVRCIVVFKEHPHIVGDEKKFFTLSTSDEVT